MKDQDLSKVSVSSYTIDKEYEKELMTKLHMVMDYFSNEFMRLENFLEKYLPLKVQNQISSTLNYTIEKKN